MSNLALISALSFILAATKTTDAGAVGENAMDIGEQRKDYTQYAASGTGLVERYQNSGDM